MSLESQKKPLDAAIADFTANLRTSEITRTIAQAAHKDASKLANKWKFPMTDNLPEFGIEVSRSGYSAYLDSKSVSVDPDSQVFLRQHIRRESAEGRFVPVVGLEGVRMLVRKSNERPRVLFVFKEEQILDAEGYILAEDDSVDAYGVLLDFKERLFEDSMKRSTSSKILTLPTQR